MLWCCCQAVGPPVVHPAQAQRFSFAQQEQGTGTIVTTAGLDPVNLDWYREAGVQAIGNGFFFDPGAVPQNLVTATLSFRGYLRAYFPPLFPPPPNVEPVLALQIFCIEYSNVAGFSFDYATEATSVVAWTIPQLPFWGAFPGIVLTTPDVADIINEKTSDPDFNFATDRLCIIFRPVTGTTQPLFATGLRSAVNPIAPNQATLNFTT